MAKDEKYERAKKRVEEIRNFYTHLAIYIVVMILLFYVDYSDGGNWWFQFVLIGWGIIVASQGISIFKFNTDWEKKKIKELMKEDD